MTAIEATDSGLILNLHVVPRASRTEWAGCRGDALKVRLQAPPVDGKANKALLRFLSKTLHLPSRRIVLLSGATGRNKRVLLREVRRQEIEIPFFSG